MPTKTYESENRKFIISAIVNNFIINVYRWNYILFEGTEHVARGVSSIEHPKEYEICHFTEDAQKIIIYLNKYGFEDAGLGKITKKSAEEVANDIKEKSGTNKEIYIYSEISEGFDELSGYAEILLYPEEKSFLKRVFRRE